ncbi:UDP-N-acetylmuramate dehydrogenase [bacterium]|nr:UDP-N-acetylmuramate dehydrogenase [bacterium]
MQIREDYEIKNLTSFKCGGRVKKIYYPESVDEFLQILKDEPKVLVFGNLTNTLISSDGYDGALLLTTRMNKVSIDGNFVTAECGVKGPKLSQEVGEKGLSGLEFMIAFPGSIGGEVFMNAGAHGQSVSDTFVEAICYDKDNGLITLTKEDMDFSYRTSICQKRDLVVLSAKFELTPDSIENIKSRMQENLDFRKAKQPSLELPNCGSVFRNPQGDSAGRLLESIGAKSFAIGDARVWENHANFIINGKNGTSLDILELIYKMYSEVKNKYDIELKPEMRFLGDKNQREVELCKLLKIK